ncbi:MAG TPA: proline racemase family protein [Longimicrobiales bacterium]|nr:proline racemase family protein [Longimicrobiales bacterium]
MTTSFPETVRVIDSHTEGEPTRVVIDGFPALAAGDMAGRARELDATHAALRCAIVCEPRGHEAMVGALLTPPVTADALAGVVFFNNVGVLGMCGHGLMGVARTLHTLGRTGSGTVRLDTPVGPVSALLGPDDAVTIRNVTPRVAMLDVTVPVPGVGTVRGDVAWGGNWFFITGQMPAPLALPNVAVLTRYAQAIRAALASRGISGDDGAEIDHVELTAPGPGGDVNARGFVLCPGGAWDRSPCGTGTSAKLAVLHARGTLQVGERWCQESVTGGRFTAWLERVSDALVPCIRGRAFITGETVLRFDVADPFRSGFTSAA